MPAPCETFVHDDAPVHCATCGHPWWEHAREQDTAGESALYIQERRWMAAYYLEELGPCPLCLREVQVPAACTPAHLDRCAARYDPGILDPTGWYPERGRRCVRPVGHSGRHLVTNGTYPEAVWKR